MFCRERGSNMWTLVLLCAVVTSHGAQAWYTTPSTAQSSCRYNCGYYLGSCSCASSCEYYGNCCSDYYSYCAAITPTIEGTTISPVTVTPPGSCRYNCGSYIGSCSCTSSCEYYGNCCSDYYSYCPTPTSATTDVTTSTGYYSCRYNCGYNFGSCSCTSSCQYYGNCCYDYNSYCYITAAPTQTIAPPSCRYNCGYNMGYCSCSSSCQYYGNCCNDYYYYCSVTNTTTEPTLSTNRPSCRYNCGSYVGSCSCTSSCEYYGNCCSDYYSYCPTPTSATTDVTTSTGYYSCRYNCGYNFGSCSCTSSCRYYGNCCYDYNFYCDSTTTPYQTTPNITTEQSSCRNKCGSRVGNCWCDMSCVNYNDCCSDFYSYCYSNTTPMPEPSCRYNCGYNMGNCSCSSSCQYYGNCCNDYYYYCSVTNTTTEPTLTTNQPSCRYNCGSYVGSCSCTSSCEYYGNCCSDYYSYCNYYTTPSSGGSCGGSLFGSGSFSSPNYPGYYYDNAYCVWQLRASSDQNIYLTFTYLQLENCCSCDYIAVYDGPSVNSRFLGKVCNDSQISFHSSSNYLTVLFRTDGSVVGRGFNAEFTSSLSPGLGRVDCSSDNMNIVISRSYLQSLGLDGHNLYLNDQYCRPDISYYNVVFSFPINTCGTVRKLDYGRIVYTNALRAYTSNYGEITRQSLLRLNVSCRMEQDSVSQILYEVRHHDNTSISGSGRYNTSMAFYTSSNFYYKVTQVPYQVTLNQNLYVQVSLRRGDSTLVLFLDTCVASPSPHDFQTRSYYLVRNGCPVDSTYYSYSSGTSPYARFTFRAFQFLRATDHVYIQCKVLICPASDYNSRCRRGCIRRKARDLGSEHESQTVVLGPIQLKEPEKKAEEAQQETKG